MTANQVSHLSRVLLNFCGRDKENYLLIRKKINGYINKDNHTAPDFLGTTEKSNSFSAAFIPLFANNGLTGSYNIKNK